MAAENLTTGTGLTGAIQKYLSKKLLLEKKFETPLANAEFGVVATIPKNAGQYVEFRLFGDIAEPAYVAEGTDPVSGATLTSSVVQVPLREIAGYISVSNMELDTDWVNFLDQAYEKLKVALLRTCHKATQTALLTTATATYYGISFTNTKCPTIYANAKANFAALAPADYLTLADFIRGRTRLENSRVPKINGLYTAVICASIRQQLEEDDRFFDVVKRNEAMAKKTVIPGHIMDFEGMRWVEQSEPFRETLGGTEGTRADTGAVRTAHLFGQECFGYSKMAGKDAKSPKFKVQDVTKTGCETTIGYRVPFVAATIQPTNGLNLKGTSKYSEANA